MTRPDRRWTVTLRPAARPGGPRLVVFPHAGSGLTPYRAVASGLADDVEVVGVALPGREGRAEESPYTRLPDLVAGVGAELSHPARAAAPRPAPVTGPGTAGHSGAPTTAPTVLYGHSMGGLLALATAYAGFRRCDGLVVSCTPPGARVAPLADPPHAPEAWVHLLGRAGLPGDAPRDGALSARQRVLAHDLGLALRTLHAVAAARLTVPLTALAGADDRLVPPEALPRWAAFTTGPFRGRLVAGGHFFPFLPAGRAALVAELTAVLDAVRRPRPVPPVAASAG